MPVTRPTWILGRIQIGSSDHTAHDHHLKRLEGYGTTPEIPFNTGFALGHRLHRRLPLLEWIDPIEDANQPSWPLYVVQHAQPRIFDFCIGDCRGQHRILRVDVHPPHNAGDRH